MVRLSSRFPLHWQIAVGLVVGASAGLAAKVLYPPGADGSADPRLAWAVRNVAEPLGQIFLRLIFMIVLPLVFSALVLGVAGLQDLRQLGRIGLRAILYTVVLSTASVVIAVVMTNTVRPGGHLTSDQRGMLRQQYAAQAAQLAAQSGGQRPVRDILLDIIPRNPFKEMVGALDGGSSGGGMLAVMFFALTVGIALLFAPSRAGPLVGVLEGIYDVSMTIVHFAMRLAPVGLAGLMFALTAMLGTDILKVLAWYVLTVLAGLTLHCLGVYSLVLALFARMNPLRFFSAISEAMLTAFATSSSNATLPTSIRVAQERLGLRREISNFVLTVGSTANQNGTALYEGVTILFLAQVFGVELSFWSQASVAIMCVLAGVGTAGIPGGSIPFLAIVLQTLGIPGEGIGIIIGVDRLLDMCRTTLNVTGDLAIAACVNGPVGLGGEAGGDTASEY